MAVELDVDLPGLSRKKQEWDQHRLPVLTAWKNELFARRSGAASLFLIFPVQFRVLLIALIMTERLAHPPVRPYGDWRRHEFSHLKSSSGQNDRTRMKTDANLRFHSCDALAFDDYIFNSLLK